MTSGRPGLVFGSATKGMMRYANISISAAKPGMEDSPFSNAGKGLRTDSFVYDHMALNQSVTFFVLIGYIQYRLPSRPGSP